MREIPLTRGYVALVDDEDFSWLSQWKWQAKSGGNGLLYATRTRHRAGAAPETVRMHREVLGVTAGREVDHRDGDGLNNQRRNLRPCTHAQNALNRRQRSVFTSRFKGVYRASKKSRMPSRPWMASISLDGHRRHLGYFADEAQAAIAYDRAAAAAHGEFAALNCDRFLEMRRVA